MTGSPAAKPKAAGYDWVDQDCPICNVPPSKFIGRRGGEAHREKLGIEAKIWSCGKCGLIFPNPMPVPRGGLDQHYSVDADDYFSGHDKEVKLVNGLDLIDRAEKLLGRKGRLLDIGVGRGETLVAAKQRGWDVEGVEPSEQFADYAEEHADSKIWRGPIEDADIPEESYDVVVLAAVLEHLYNPDEVIRKIASVLKKGGLLYVDVPNENGLYFKVGNMYQKLRGRDWCVNLAPTFSPYHLFGFGVRSLHRLLAKHHLRPAKWEVVGGTSMVSSRAGIAGKIESAASVVVTKISNFGEMGTYIETWAVKE